MRFGAALALVALALPVFAQHGGGHAGSSGSHGFAGHTGFSGTSGFSRGGSVGFSRAGSFVRPAAPIRYGVSGHAGLRGIGAPPYAGRPFSGFPNRFTGARPAYRAMGSESVGPERSHNWERGGDRDRDRFDARRRSFDDWYAGVYPVWPGYGYGYPYVIDPGFYDWSLPDDSASEDESGMSSGYDAGGAGPDYPAPYPQYGYGAPGEDYGDGPAGVMPGYAGEIQPRAAQSQPRAALGLAAPPAPRSEQMLTVIFKDDRAPVKMQNYMMTANLLTDLDAQHYEQIPIDQIDIAATELVNKAAGLRFAIPAASRN